MGIGHAANYAASHPLRLARLPGVTMGAHYYDWEGLAVSKERRENMS